MIPYAATRIDPAELEVFARIRQVVTALSDDLVDGSGQKIEITCHKLARAIGRAFRLDWVDGYFVLPSFNHSWVVIGQKPRHEDRRVIDVYPVGAVGGPILWDRTYALCPVYVELPTQFVSKRAGQNNPAQRFSHPQFREHVAILHREIKRLDRMPVAQPRLPL